MKFSLTLSRKINLVNLMREFGYHYDRRTSTPDQLSFIRPLGSSFYPRFHLYSSYKEDSGEIFFNLHLDQKAPVYKGANAHSGEYKGERVEEEARRIKKAITLNKSK